MSKLTFVLVLATGCGETMSIDTEALRGKIAIPNADAKAPYSTACGSATPQLCSPQGGPVLADAEIASVMWAPTSVQALADAFYTTFGKDGAGYLGLLSEYGIHSATYVGSTNLNKPITRHDCTYAYKDDTTGIVTTAIVSCDVVKGAVVLSNLAQAIADGTVPANIPNASYYPVHFPDDVWVLNDFNSGWIGLQPMANILDWHTSIDCRATPALQNQFTSGGFEAGFPHCGLDPNVAPLQPGQPVVGLGCWLRSDANHAVITHAAHTGNNAVRLTSAASVEQRIFVPPCGTGASGAHLELWAEGQGVANGPTPTLTVLAQHWEWSNSANAVVPAGVVQVGKVSFPGTAPPKYQHFSFDVGSHGGYWTDFTFVSDATGDAFISVDDVAIANPNDIGVVAYGILHQPASNAGIEAVFAHELIEALTDPYQDVPAFNTNSWAPGNEEIADICNNAGPACMIDPTTKQSFLIAPPWSNALQSCVEMNQSTSIPCP